MACCTVCRSAAAAFTAVETQSIDSALLCRSDDCRRRFLNGRQCVVVIGPKHNDDDDEKEDSKAKRPMDSTAVWLRKMQERRSSNDRFFMHQGGKVFDDTVLPHDVCPLLEQYRIVSVLGSGSSLAVVFLVAQRTTTDDSSSSSAAGSPSSSPPESTRHEFAAKFEMITEDTLFAMQAELGINVLLSRLPPIHKLNIVQMLDWVRCEMDIRQAVPVGVTLPRAINREAQPDDEWQVMIMEGASGSLAQLLIPHLAANVTDPVERAHFIKALVTQIVCTQWFLYDQFEFLHRDLHEGNILLAPADESLLTKLTVCYEIRGRFLILVPLQWTRYHLAKLADMGRARARYQSGSDGEKHTIGAYSTDHNPPLPRNATPFPRAKNILATELSYVSGLSALLYQAKIAIDSRSEAQLQSLSGMCRLLSSGKESDYDLAKLFTLPFFEEMRVDVAEKDRLLQDPTCFFIDAEPVAVAQERIESCRNAELIIKY